MKKPVLLLLAVSLFTTSVVYAAKYKINTSGVVKTQGGQIISQPSNTVNQNYFHNYQAQSYIANNQVNSVQAGIAEIVMDYSGSMYNWINVAKRSMSAIVAQIPSTTQLGFRVFGHDQNGSNPTSLNTVRQVKKVIKKNGKYQVITEKDKCLGSTRGVCSATVQVSPVAGANANNILSGMNSVNIGGATPLVYALDRTVYQDFAKFDTYSPKKIILITDGGENCGGDPCAFARQLMSKRNDIHIDVVLVSSNSRALACLANTTGGKFYTVKNLADFTNTVSDSIQQIPEQTQPPQNYEFVK